MDKEEREQYVRDFINRAMWSGIRKALQENRQNGSKENKPLCPEPEKGEVKTGNDGSPGSKGSQDNTGKLVQIRKRGTMAKDGILSVLHLSGRKTAKSILTKLASSIRGRGPLSAAP